MVKMDVQVSLGQKVKRDLLACLVSQACQACLVSLGSMGLKELLVQWEKEEAQEFWDFKVKKVTEAM